MSQRSSFGNERLNTILKSFNDQTLNIASYDEFNQAIRDERKNKDKEAILVSTRTKLTSLLKKISDEIQVLVNKIAEIKSPNLAKPTDGTDSFSSIKLINQKVFGAVDFGNALKVAEMKPDNIHEILKEAVEHKRNEFFFTVTNLILSDTNINQAYKLRVQGIYESLTEMLGLTELEDQKTNLERDLIEVKDYLEMDLSTLEAKVRTAIKVARRMTETGQLEAETVLAQ